MMHSLNIHPKATHQLRLVLDQRPNHSDHLNHSLVLPIGYWLKRSKRRSVGLSIGSDGLIVTAPIQTSQSEIDSILQKKAIWIAQKLEQMAQRQLQKQEQQTQAAQEPHSSLLKKARLHFAQRLDYFAPILGVQYRTFRLTRAQTRWGSANRLGDIRLNWRLIQLPSEVIDYVVVHELAHLLEMNHSPRFWAHVQRVLPNYIELRLALKQVAI